MFFLFNKEGGIFFNSPFFFQIFFLTCQKLFNMNETQFAKIAELHGEIQELNHEIEVLKRINEQLKNQLIKND